MPHFKPAQHLNTVLQFELMCHRQDPTALIAACLSIYRLRVCRVSAICYSLAPFCTVINAKPSKGSLSNISSLRFGPVHSGLTQYVSILEPHMQKPKSVGFTRGFTTVLLTHSLNCPFLK